MSTLTPKENYFKELCNVMNCFLTDKKEEVLLRGRRWREKDKRGHGAMGGGRITDEQPGVLRKVVKSVDLFWQQLQPL